VVQRKVPTVVGLECFPFEERWGELGFIILGKGWLQEHLHGVTEEVE